MENTEFKTDFLSVTLSKDKLETEPIAIKGNVNVRFFRINDIKLKVQLLNANGMESEKFEVNKYIIIDTEGFGSIKFLYEKLDEDKEISIVYVDCDLRKV
jgi:hypothetical protein